jgi:hypothetical protein
MEAHLVDEALWAVVWQRGILLRWGCHPERNSGGRQPGARIGAAGCHIASTSQAKQPKSFGAPIRPALVWCGVPVAFSLFNTAPGPGHTRVWACWIDQQAAKLTPSK